MTFNRTVENIFLDRRTHHSMENLCRISAKRKLRSDQD